jgi:hypothetical protein
MAKFRTVETISIEKNLCTWKMDVLFKYVDLFHVDDFLEKRVYYFLFLQIQL